jgi:Fe-S-cluster containining protein
MERIISYHEILYMKGVRKLLHMTSVSPCLSCGACCAFYRASFYWAEADEAVGGKVPVGMTEKLNEFFRVMKGTNQKNPRCIALEGEIGKCASCSIYELRSSVCREFEVSWENGKRNERCDKARIAWGLAPLDAPSPDIDSDPTGDLPRAA